MAQRPTVVREGAWNARALVRWPGLLRAEPHVISRQQAAEGVASRGLDRAWVLASMAERLASGEVAPVRHEAV